MVLWLLLNNFKVLVVWRRLSQHCLFTTYIHPSLHCSSRSASVSADWAALILLLNIHQDLLLFQWFVDQWHADNRTIIQHCTIMQVQESPHEYLWEQTLRKKEINLCCVSQKTVAALWNKHLKHKKPEHVVVTSGDFLAFPSEFCFFACSCIWAVCDITTLRYQIPQPISHLKQHKLLQASCGVFWGSVT